MVRGGGQCGGDQGVEITCTVLKNSDYENSTKSRVSLIKAAESKTFDIN